AHAIARGDAELGRELLADLDELLGLHDRVEPHVLRPEMEMLRETVRRRDVRELCRVTELAPVAFEDARGRVADRATLVGIERVVAERRLERLVVLGERPVGEGRPSEEPRNAFLVHDERPHAGCRVLVDRIVRRVGADPARAVPLDELALWIPRASARIARRAVVEHAAVRWPRPGPVQRLTDAGRIRVVAARHLVAGLGPAARIDPAAARRRAVGAQLTEARKLLAGAADDPRRLRLVDDVRERLAVVLL